MTVDIKKEKDNLVVMELIIPAKDAQKAFDKAVSEISNYVSIDGFRKGKAPKAMVLKHVGTDRVTAEAVQALAPKMISQAVSDNNLDIITQPAITSYSYEEGKDMKVTVHVETRPEVTLGEYKGLKLKIEDSPIPDDAEQKAIDSLLKQHSTLETVSDRAANNTDTALIDFDGYVDGEKIVGGEGKNYSLDLGNSTFIPGFAEQIVGKNAGDEFEINVKFPKDYHDEKLKGKDAVFKIKLHEIKSRIMPELNDDFAKKVGPFNSVDDLKADVQKYLTSQREKTIKQNSEAEIFKNIIDNSKVDVPETLIARELESIKADYKQRLSYQGISWDNIVKAEGGEDKLEKLLRDDAIGRIKNSLVIDKIAKVEGIKIDAKDLELKFEQLSSVYGMNKQDIIKQLSQSPEMFGSLSQQALNDKVRDYLVENNNVEVVSK